MALTITSADPLADYEALAQFLNEFEPDPISAAQIREWDARQADSILRRHILRGAGGTVHGYSVVLHGPWEPEGRFYLWLAVDKTQRGQGWGQALYDEALAFIQSYNGTRINSEVSEVEIEGLRFAEARGFVRIRHTFSSVLDLQGFDFSESMGAIEEVERAGIRFFSLADVGDTPEARRRLYDINARVAMDDPGSDGTFISFEQFNHNFDTASWYRPAGQIVAADGPRYVGLAAVGYFADANMIYNMITGVDREYRGRRIAQALKLLTIRYAQEVGADYIRTNNNSENAPMLAINRKLGYRPEPGLYTMSLRLEHD